MCHAVLGNVKRARRRGQKEERKEEREEKIGP